MTHLLTTFTKRLTNLALDAAAYGVAVVCDNYPRLEEKRLICQLRLKLADAYCRIADLEEVVRDYRAMHELQHGQTCHLPLTTDQNEGDPHDLN